LQHWRTNFELRFEFFSNVTNSASFDFPTAVLTSATFGRLDALVSVARKIRIGAKINF
jgi:hypothetical protein